MSNIGQLNQRLKLKTEAKKKAQEEQAEQELMDFTANLKTAYQKELNIIKKDISDQNEHLRQVLLEIKSKNQEIVAEIKKKSMLSWLKPTLIALLALLTILGSSWGLMQYLTTQIQTQLTQIKTNQETMKILEKKGGFIDFKNCGPDKSLCVQIDQKAGTYGDGGYMILKKK